MENELGIKQVIEECAKVAQNRDLVDLAIVIMPTSILKRGTKSELLKFLIDIWPGFRDLLKATAIASSEITSQTIAMNIRKLKDQVDIGKSMLN
jgi:hypothetical protein